MAADGSGSEHIYFNGGGSKSQNPQAAAVILKINGQAVYNFAVKALTETIEKLLAQENITMDEISLIVPHQANARIIQAAAKRLKIPEEKFFMNIEEYANTSAASIPIALDELNRGRKIRQGDLIMTIGFGGGLTYGGNLIRW